MPHASKGIFFKYIATVKYKLNKYLGNLFHNRIFAIKDGFVYRLENDLFNGRLLCLMKNYFGLRF